MKLLTISIAAYNVDKFLDKCLESLKDSRYRDDIEVLVIDDGSKDHTSEIAQKYQDEFPETFKYISKENGGHGSTINKGIELASGKYFRVIDGDDWVDPDNFYEYILKLRMTNSDMVLTQHKEISPTKGKLISLVQGMEDGTEYSLDKNLNIHRITLHMLTIKTKLLKENNVKITENCFYVDVEYVAWSIYLAQTVTYFKLPVYMYRVGNINQSVSKKNMLKNVDMQKKVSYKLVSLYSTFLKSNLMSDSKDKVIYRTIKKSVGSTIRTYLLLDNTADVKEQIITYEGEIRKISKIVYKRLDTDLFIHVIRKWNYKIIPLVKALYRVWCLKYAN